MKEKSCQKPISIQAHPRTACHPKKSYIITGGLGGFGLELAHWLVDRGARNLILTSRSGIRNGYQSRKVRVLREHGINVKVSTSNVRTKKEAEHLIKEASELGTVGGIFHLAMVCFSVNYNTSTENNVKDVLIFVTTCIVGRLPEDFALFKMQRYTC